MTRLRFVLLALAMVTAVGPAAAQEQTETGTRLAAPKSRNLGSVAMTAKDQAVGAKRFAECLYNRKATLARQALQAQTHEAASAAMDKLMGEIRCFGDDMSNDLVGMRTVQFPRDILRGMLAETALGREDERVAALQPLALQQIYQRNWFATTGRHISVDEMAACIADTNPAGIVALTKTVPTTKEEGAAFSALGGNLHACLRAGTKLQASRQSLRAALADALYQRLNAPTAAATTAVEAAKN
jgi:hypothetical protein